MTWVAVLAGSALAYLAKLVGYVVPGTLLDRPLVRAAAAMMPVAMLAALVVVQTVAVGSRVALDARLAGLAAAVVALLLRAPFLVVVLVAAVVAASVRAVGLAP